MTQRDQYLRMNSSVAREKLALYTQLLTKACRDTPSVIGLVLVGSVVDTARIDEWSDHDFFLFTDSGAQETLRLNLSWLPSSEQIAFFFRETEHGLKVVYNSGAVLEFAIFDVAELRSCAVNHHALAFGTHDSIVSIPCVVSKLFIPNSVARSPMPWKSNLK